MSAVGRWYPCASFGLSGKTGGLVSFYEGASWNALVHPFMESSRFVGAPHSPWLRMYASVLQMGETCALFVLLCYLFTSLPEPIECIRRARLIPS